MTSTPKVFGRRWRTRIRCQRAPTARAARTNSFCFCAARAEDLGRDDREGQVGEAVERVEQPHEDVVDESAHETGDGAVDDADHEDGKRACEADSDRDTPADGHAREEIAAELVGAEGMLPARGQVGLGKVDQVRVVRREDGLEEAVENDEHEDRRRGDSRSVAREAVDGVFPEAGPAHGSTRRSVGEVEARLRSRERRLAVIDSHQHHKTIWD
jgi:hypothetical protein